MPEATKARVLPGSRRYVQRKKAVAEIGLYRRIGLDGAEMDERAGCISRLLEELPSGGLNGRLIGLFAHPAGYLESEFFDTEAKLPDHDDLPIDSQWNDIDPGERIEAPERMLLMGDR